MMQSRFARLAAIMRYKMICIYTQPDQHAACKSPYPNNISTITETIFWGNIFDKSSFLDQKYYIFYDFL